MADLEHVDIDDPNIHEPKGASTAGTSQVYLSDGAGSGAWTNLVDSVFPASGRWNQIYIPAQGIALSGGVTDAARSTTNGTFLFDSATDEIVITGVPIPRDRLSTSDLRFYVLWSKTTSATGDVAWQMEYKVLNFNAVTSGGWTSLGIETTPNTTDDDTADRLMATYLDGLDMTTLTNEMNLLLRLSRVGTDAGDTYGADAEVYSIVCTYNIADIGSSVEFT